MRWRSALAGDRSLEALNGLEVIAALRGCQPECNTSAHRGSRVACSESLREDLLELAPGCGEIVGQAKFELGVGEAKLTIVDVADVATGLQVLDRDSQLLSQFAERLDRRRACAGLDA